MNVKAGSDVEGTIIHETGHAVDAQMGWSTGAEPAKPERGGWKLYGVRWADAATDMVADSAGGITSKLTAPQRTDVINAMAAGMRNRSAATIEPAIQALPWFPTLAAPDRRAVLRDPALPAIAVGLDQPYFKFPDKTGGGDHLGAHIYQESYSPQWVRYQHQARARMVSPYQFRDEGEWFAECYRAYYEPDKRGLGAKLEKDAKDVSTKQYFDTHVHTFAPSR